MKRQLSLLAVALLLAQPVLAKDIPLNRAAALANSVTPAASSQAYDDLEQQALAGGDLEQALIWTEWTMEFNASIFSAERANYYRCLQTLLLLSQEEERQPLQYLNAFIRMYGADAVEAASAALSGEAPFYGLQAVDSDLQAFPAHQSLLKAYEKLQRAKAAFWAK